VKKAAGKHSVDAEDLKTRVLDARIVLRQWMDGKNPWSQKLSVKAVEKSIAFHVVRRTVRKIKNPTEDTHEYLDIEKNEFPGTVDLVLENRNRTVVLDYKTGFDVSYPDRSGQLRSLALGFRSHREMVLAFLHAPSHSGPVIYAAEINDETLIKHKDAIAKAWDKIGDGSLRPGPACAYCPAAQQCPLNANNLVELKAKGDLTAARVGQIHETLGAYDKLAKMLRERICGYVRANGPVQRPDGKILDFVTRPFSNLSGASIKRALGEVEGAKMLELLEKKKCIEHGEREELRAIAEGIK